MKTKQDAHNELIREKLKLQLKANLLEKRLKDNFEYLQDNSREILISSAIMLLRPSGNKKNIQRGQSPESIHIGGKVLEMISEYSPVIWDFLRS